jgi:hypothetical protein
MKYLLVFLLLLLPQLAWAQEPPIEAIPPGDDVITPLRRGQVAPHDGQLFDAMTALRWANWLQQYKYRLVWDLEKSESTCRSGLAYKEELLRAEEERALKVEKELEKRLAETQQALKDAESPPWYETRTFGMVVGAGLAVGAVAMGIWAIEASQ